MPSRRLSWAALLALGIGYASPVVAQAPAANAPPDARTFMEFAFSTATLQARASELAASRDTRPEVKVFAEEMAAFRREQLSRLQGFAGEHGIPIPTVKDFEHQVMLENLEPLDYLALSRRYAEVQVQALDQELRAYRAAGQAADPDLKQWAEQGLPVLQGHFERAGKMREAVGP